VVRADRGIGSITPQINQIARVSIEVPNAAATIPAEIKMPEPITLPTTSEVHSRSPRSRLRAVSKPPSGGSADGVSDSIMRSFFDEILSIPFHKYGVI
jgi:hypothetical protein